MAVTTAPVIIVGTYESALVGFDIIGGGDSPISTKLKFTNQCHIGHVLSVATQSSFVASGGDDECIRLLDIRRCVELGSLTHHEGSIHKLVFKESGGKLFLVCASADGTMSVWKCSQWECLHSLTGHKGAVSSVDIHPSGRFMLSVSVDRSLMTWNLMTGRQAFITKLPKASTDVKFSPDGGMFFLVVSGAIDVYDTATVAVKCTIHGDVAISAAVWWSNNNIVVGDQEGTLRLVKVGDEMEDQAQIKEVHKSRVKCLSTTSVGGKQLLVSASSDSLLVVWIVGKRRFEQLSSANVPGRPICMTICN